MIKSTLRKTFSRFKENPLEYLTVSIIVSFVSFLAIVLGYFLIESSGVFLTFIFIIIPMIIGFKYTVYNSIAKKKIHNRLLTLGFKTYFKSIKIYLSTLVKPILIGILAYFIVQLAGGSILSIMITIANPGFIEAAGLSFETMMEMIFENESVKNILTVINTVSFFGFVAVFLIAKAKRSFIPYLAFSALLTVADMNKYNKKIIKGKFFDYLMVNLIVGLLFIIPFAISYLFYNFVFVSEMMDKVIILLGSVGIFFVIATPIFVLLQIASAHFYRDVSKPYKKDMQKELVSLIRKISIESGNLNQEQINTLKKMEKAIAEKKDEASKEDNKEASDNDDSEEN